MKKLILLSILLIVGCASNSTEPQQTQQDSLGNCVLYESYFGGVDIVTWYYCYEDVYTKKECLDKADTSDKSYSEYLNSQSCSDFCKEKGSHCNQY